MLHFGMMPRTSSRSSLMCRYLIWNVCILLLAFHFAKGIPCEQVGYFGDDCKFQCHCKGDVSNCQTDGNCLDGCDKNYMGSQCQVGILTSWSGKGITHLPGAVDCAANKLSEITIKIDPAQPIGWIRIRSRASLVNRLNYLKMMVDDTFLPCSWPTINFDGTSSVDLRCTKLSKKVSLIKFEAESLSDWCEISISGGRNLALKQRSGSSSIYPKKRSTYTHEHGADGDPKTCVLTYKGKQDQFYTVFFDAPIDVYKIFIQYDPKRTKRTIETIVRAYRKQKEVFSFENLSGKVTSMTAIPDEILRGVTSIQIIKPRGVRGSGDDYLNFCEITVDGECPNHVYGPWCTKVARTSKPWELCTSDDGCRECASGYTGEFCHATCTDGFWGRGCKNRCSPYCNATSCNSDNGICLFGCLGGKKPPLCKGAIDTVDKDNIKLGRTLIIASACAISAAFAACILYQTMGSSTYSDYPNYMEDEQIGWQPAMQTAYSETTQHTKGMNSISRTSQSTNRPSMKAMNSNFRISQGTNRISMKSMESNSRISQSTNRPSARISLDRDDPI